MQISLPTIEGKHNNAAVRMYTDWKRLQDAMGDGWKGMIQPIDGIIDQFDCAINLTEHEKPAAMSIRKCSGKCSPLRKISNKIIDKK